MNFKEKKYLLHGRLNARLFELGINYDQYYDLLINDQETKEKELFYNINFENQINLGEIEFVSDYILKYMNTSDVFKSLYGEYDFYNYMTSFIAPLYATNKNLEARNLYEKIKKSITSRLDQLITAKNESNSEYINSLSSQELISFENLILKI